MLHEAAEHGNDKLVERYVVNNPDNTESEMIMLSCDNEKRNALHKAAVNGHSKCVELLLEHSTVLQAHIDKKDRFGCTALYLACVKNTIVLDNGSFATLEQVVEIKLQIVKLLLDNGAKPRDAWKKGRGTALHWCAVHGYDTVAQALLSHVDNKGDRGGQTLLYLVDNNGDLPIDVAGNEVLRRRYRFEEQMVKLEEDPDNNLQKNNRERRELAPVTRYNKETRLKYQTVKQRQPSTKLEGILMRYEACAVALMTTVQVDVKKTDYRLRWLQSMLVWCSYLGLIFLGK
jgi:ankyrin repeat protein